MRDRNVRWEDVDTRVSPAPDPIEQKIAITSTPKPPPPPEPVAPEAPPVIVASKSPITIDGKSVGDGDVVDMPALELVCLADPRALTEPERVQARFDEVVRKEGVSVGAFQFVRLLRDPARSVVDPPPRLCRTLESATQIKAPLEREREPASRWIVVQIKTSLPEDAARVVQLLEKNQLAPTATPRVLLDDDGKPVGVAIPGGA